MAVKSKRWNKGI